MNVDKSNARVRRMFGQIAPKYDRMNHLLSLNIDYYWRWRTTRLIDVNCAAPILDVCTGTGDLALAFHRRTRGRTRVVGADFCREMLEVGEQKKRRAGIADRLAFVEADAQELPFDDDQFQLVSVAFGLRNVADTDRGLREMARVCRPGGQVAVLEFSMPRWQPLRAIYAWYFRHVLPRLGQLLARNDESAYNYLPQSVGEFPSGDALAQRMEDAGLQRVSYRALTMGVASLYVGVK
ncbi:MAG: bifunctional demethylmenaquinone methyltransferase/2-methoxy-6-polyprenyl-1,4-benzoquinol methylase UbiE [Pirellulaceae bacterium]|jgi:demethylmenaquinone methyltransferase/2-methoxy-6-polyprenyl-1,4-benzoquinol methylase|nr:bifunctional demethylmenaquinone methyltransferase/2-methoxy-6-polyprenyl-1,4-benzoquinol methylase UbiE [Pirellulaceae bacterium]MDP7019793.1 bifunctional demethylmenaquinone methyltransferase/2-methoxy-6-polyprenyl-1,4-benzoquinol methylase UbiE [Pirellulaceae bacterium]